MAVAVVDSKVPVRVFRATVRCACGAHLDFLTPPVSNKVPEETPIFEGWHCPGRKCLLVGVVRVEDPTWEQIVEAYGL